MGREYDLQAHIPNCIQTRTQFVLLRFALAILGVI